jgi:hypothetical protein
VKNSLDVSSNYFTVIEKHVLIQMGYVLTVNSNISLIVSASKSPNVSNFSFLPRDGSNILQFIREGDSNKEVEGLLFYVSQNTKKATWPSKSFTIHWGG